MGARFSAFRLAVRRIFSESLPGAVLGKRTSRVISQQLDQAMPGDVCGADWPKGQAPRFSSRRSGVPGSHALLISWGIVVILTNHFFDRIQPPFLRG